VSSAYDAAERERELRAQVERDPVIQLDEFRRKSRRSFLTGGAGIIAGYVGWRFLQGRPEQDGIPDLLRSTLELNESIWSNLSRSRSAPEYAVADASPIQVNGIIGIRNEIDLADWTVRVEGPDGELLDELDISAFEALPQQEIAYEHKCIEGWSNITHWGGPRFADFHARYADRVGDVPYVGLETPDGHYYVGWDIESILHPQTILALREHGEPLTQNHGAPLRLATPNKYGIKCLKRIGVIRYAHERPADYWAERSYDWYAAL
jgi:DMSO/TMAO reductase YedYZ molybdopterin-dependent catalytic subunit